MQETQQPECDWQNDKLKYHDHQIGEMLSWIKTKKDTLGPAVMLRQHTCHIDVHTFSDMQRHAYNIVKTHSEQAYPTDPLLLIVLGVAGTGKLSNQCYSKLTSILLCSNCYNRKSFI